MTAARRSCSSTVNCPDRCQRPLRWKTFERRSLRKEDRCSKMGCAKLTVARADFRPRDPTGTGGGPERIRQGLG